MKSLTGTALVIIILLGCSSKITFPVLSEKIYDKNSGLNDKSTFKLSSYERDARIKAYLLDSSSFLKGKLKDTIYLIEAYNIEVAIFYGTIWNKSHELNYSYTKGTCILQSKPLFTDYQIKLVTDWDTIQIRKEDKISKHWLDNNLLITGIRCYRTGGNWAIDEIPLSNFINSKREYKNP